MVCNIRMLGNKSKHEQLRPDSRPSRQYMEDILASDQMIELMDAISDMQLCSKSNLQGDIPMKPNS